MAQYSFGTIDPNTKSGTALATDLNSWRDAVNSTHSGSTAPSYLTSSMLWSDTTSANFELKMYDGAQWIPVAVLDATNNVARVAVDSAETSYITATTAAQIKHVIANVDTMTVRSTGLQFNIAAPVISDSNANELLSFQTAASAVNHIDIANSATGNAPTISAVGNDTNIGIALISKGTGPVAVSTGGAERLRIADAGQIGIGGANYGTSGQVITSGGPSAAPSWTTPATGVTLNYQEFTSSGTWTKPAGVSVVYVEAVGGGGSGGVARSTGSNAASGGNGGEGAFRTFRAADLGATVTVTIGAGGAAVTRSTDGATAGNGGGTTSFGTVISATGGAGGTAAVAPSGGVNSPSTAPLYDLAFNGQGGSALSNGCTAGTSSILGGGGGGAGSAGVSMNTPLSSSGGTSQWAGAGGAGGTGAGTATSGAAGGGGGGGRASSTGTVTSGAGGAGRVRVWAW
jgi:hypothetical protein